MRTLFFASVLLLAACDQAEAPSTPAVDEHAVAAADSGPAAAPAAASESNLGGGMTMTAEDPGGFTADGFTVHTRPGTKHIVRLEAPGTDTWRAASTGEPIIKPVGERKETTPEGKAALVFEYEALQSGNVTIKFERLEDGEVEASRSINFMVH